MEAEDRLGFITDVSMLFAGKGERGHIARLAREAEGGSSKRSAKAGLRMDDQSGEAKESGAYVPGKSYEEA